MSAEILKTILYKDTKINVTLYQGSVTFVVEHPEFKNEYGNKAASLTEAKERIDKLLSAKARITARSMDIAHKAMTGDGETLTIKGINRNDGSVRVSDFTPTNYRGFATVSKSFSGRVYVDRPWIRALLLEQKALRASLKEIEDRLHPVEVTVGQRSYGRKVEISQYGPMMERMTTELERAVERANEAEAKASKKEDVNVD